MIVDANIIFNIDDIFIETQTARSLLVVGQVQSGKTRFMIEKTKEAFSVQNYDCVILIGGTNNLLLNQTDSRFIDEFKNLDVKYIEIKSSIYDDIPNGKVLISTLKSKVQLEKTIHLMKYSWKNKKVLIIDDESDYGGINTSDNEEKPTTLHVLIKKLIKSIHNGLHISITATPFADILSEYTHFDSIHILKPNNEYTGLKYFSERESIFVKSIVDVELREMKGYRKQWIEILIDHIKRVHESKLSVSQLLINTSLLNSVHDDFQKQFIDYLNLLSLIPLEQLFGFNSNDEPEKISEYSNIIKEMKENVFCLNENNSVWSKKEHSIIIGGASVSRGYTFERLITTVMFNEAKGMVSADTLLQRCRWFGYRRDISDYMKVYCSDKIIKSLQECSILLKIIEENHKSIEDIRKIIKATEFEFIEPTGKIKGNKNDT